MFNIDVWNSDAEYIVIDDIDWEYIPCKKALFGAQLEFTITDKYRKKRRVKWGKPCILLANEDGDPYEKMSQKEKKWYDENVTLCYVNNKLY